MPEANGKPAILSRGASAVVPGPRTPRSASGADEERVAIRHFLVLWGWAHWYILLRHGTVLMKMRPIEYMKTCQILGG